jgi:hypothetical protein
VVRSRLVERKWSRVVGKFSLKLPAKRRCGFAIVCGDGSARGRDLDVGLRQESVCHVNMESTDTIYRTTLCRHQAVDTPAF